MNWLRDHIENGTACLDMHEFEDYRADGWPLCPKCGNDELQNPRVGTGAVTTPTLQAFIQDGLKCLACGWESEQWRRHYR